MTYEIRKLSVSQAEQFDPSQTGGCELKWWFHHPGGIEVEETKSKEDGTSGHGLLAHYLVSGERPKGRIRMGKAVTGAIQKGKLPTPNPGLVVERRFDDQPQRDAAGEWIPLDTNRTPIHIGGLPWDGFIDLMWCSDSVIDVLDHKFSSDIWAPWTKRGADLIKTIQMPTYVLKARTIWPHAQGFRLHHHYVSRRGVDSDLRSSPILDFGWVDERVADIARVVGRMKTVAAITDPMDSPFNRNACSAFGGCPHQTRCPRFKEKPVVNLTPEEEALFGPATPAAPPQAAPAVAAPAAPAVILQDCADCGTALNQENSSKLRSGAYKHLSCPKSTVPPPPIVVPVAAAPAAVIPPDAPPNNAAEPPPAKKGAKKKETEAPREVTQTIPEAATASMSVVEPVVVRHVIELGPETTKLLRAIFNR